MTRASQAPPVNRGDLAHKVYYWSPSHKSPSMFNTDLQSQPMHHLPIRVTALRTAPRAHCRGMQNVVEINLIQWCLTTSTHPWGCAELFSVRHA